VQVNVDATAMSQAFMGAATSGGSSSGTADLQRASQCRQPGARPAHTRALFNPNLEGGWFLAVIQIVNNITILAIILTGTALLREREHGTLDHLLVLPLTALEIMLAKIWSNMLVVVLCTWLSLEVVVKGCSACRWPGRWPVPVGDGAVPVCQHRAGHLPRHPGALDAAVRPAGDPGDHPDAAAVRRQHAAGQHARMVAVGDAGLAVDTLCQPERRDPVPRCG
jgi:hypothetical protein